MESGVTTEHREPFELEYLLGDSELFKFVESFMKKSSRNNHGWLPGEIVVKHVWKIIRDDSERIEKPQKEISSRKKVFSEKPIYIPERTDLKPEQVELYNMSNTNILFHGTRSVNVGGILKSTLRLPSQLVGVSTNGAMFGGGLYFADDWRKSAGYTSLKLSYYSNGSGSIQGRDAFIFLTDVVLGQPHVAKGTKGFVKPPNGCDSVLGKAGVSGVANNEFITYYTDSNSLRYLVEFNTK